jgi:hypothetical protein
MSTLRPVVVFGIATTLACTAALADQAAALPNEQVQGSVHFISGGIGKDEAAAMQHAMKRYPLSLEFVAKARTRDEFLADVPVTVQDSRGHVVLKTMSTGPFLLINVHPGKYVVTAEQGGKTEKRTAEVQTKGGERLVFEWNAA